MRGLFGLHENENETESDDDDDGIIKCMTNGVTKNPSVPCPRDNVKV